jgi:DNA/RNA-binding domain of Phe-tRNA-synthetase-like protein
MPDNICYSVDDEVFRRFPGYTRGVVLAYDVGNGVSPNELIKLLRAAESSARERLILDDLATHPRIASWREAYRSFGANPGKFRSSIEGMVRRVLRDQELPSINALVDIGNVFSLRHIVPTGGHAIDVIREDICLRPANGDEVFIPFGSDQTEHPEPGEIVFVEGSTVLTRRWSWRQANHTLTLPTTSAIEFNVDGLPPVTTEEVTTISGELAEAIERFCGGRTRCELLTSESPRIVLNE